MGDAARADDGIVRGAGQVMGDTIYPVAGVVPVVGVSAGPGDHGRKDSVLERFQPHAPGPLSSFGPRGPAAFGVAQLSGQPSPPPTWKHGLTPSLRLYKAGITAYCDWLNKPC